jgi:hypothetical protein
MRLREGSLENTAGLIHLIISLFAVSYHFYRSPSLRGILLVTRESKRISTNHAYCGCGKETRSLGSMVAVADICKVLNVRLVLSNSCLLHHFHFRS